VQVLGDDDKSLQWVAGVANAILDIARKGENERLLEAETRFLHQV
jgi:hypothetical protein